MTKTIAQEARDVLKLYNLTLGRTSPANNDDHMQIIRHDPSGFDTTVVLPDPPAGMNYYEALQDDSLATRIVEAADNYEPLANFETLVQARVFAIEAPKIETAAIRLKNDLESVAYVLSNDFGIPRDPDALSLDASVKDWLEKSQVLYDFTSIDMFPSLREGLDPAITFRDIKEQGDAGVKMLENYTSAGIEEDDIERIMAATIRERTARDFDRDVDIIQGFFEQNGLSLSYGPNGFTFDPMPNASGGPVIPFSHASDIKSLVNDIQRLEDNWRPADLAGVIEMYASTDSDLIFDEARDAYRSIEAIVDAVERTYPDIVFELDMDRHANEVAMRQLDYALDQLIDDSPKKTIQDIKEKHSKLNEQKPAQNTPAMPAR